jgi:hypothetical protein
MAIEEILIGSTVPTPISWAVQLSTNVGIRTRVKKV